LRPRAPGAVPARRGGRAAEGAAMKMVAVKAGVQKDKSWGGGVSIGGQVRRLVSEGLGQG